MHASSTATEPTPTPERERILTLDVLRGFALFGILLVNMEDFSAPNGRGLRDEFAGSPHLGGGVLP